jgi:hypothetical protein
VERGWGVNVLEDARHCSVLYICKYFVLYINLAAYIERWQHVPERTLYSLYFQFSGVAGHTASEPAQHTHAQLQSHPKSPLPFIFVRVIHTQIQIMIMSGTFF